ncbi:MAG TPA: EamA family transporter [Verrucomicrobiae bacterium]|nr:EamA family transporter [Verrucomicrobiae bacterium]
MSHDKSEHPNHPTLVLFCFAVVYLVWGSTFYAIRLGIQSFPPHLLAGFRYLFAGAVVYPVLRATTKETPTWPQWRTTLIAGALLFCIGNGTVSWSELRVPSGIAALLVATVSLWMVLVDWLRPGGVRPPPRVIAGFFLGFAGMALLVGPKHLGNSERIDPIGAFALIAASLAWAIGSIYLRHHPLPRSPLLGAGMQMLCGGLLLCFTSLAIGETRHFHFADVTLRSWIALLYLTAFGTGLGFSAYAYILRHSTASRVATYAFVNPVVALFLGWLLAAEPLTLRTALASGIILTAVLLVITAPHKTQIEAEESIPVPGEA